MSVPTVMVRTDNLFCLMPLPTACKELVLILQVKISPVTVGVGTCWQL